VLLRACDLFGTAIRVAASSDLSCTALGVGARLRFVLHCDSCCTAFYGAFRSTVRFDLPCISICGAFRSAVHFDLRCAALCIAPRFALYCDSLRIVIREFALRFVLMLAMEHASKGTELF
jgi:hypothetical protein